MQEQRKVYAMPKYLDELPELIFIPADVVIAFLIVFIPINFANQLLGVVCGIIAAFWYSRAKKGKPRNYWMLIIYRLGFLKVDGVPPPTMKEIGW